MAGLPADVRDRDHAAFALDENGNVCRVTCEFQAIPNDVHVGLIGVDASPTVGGMIAQEGNVDEGRVRVVVQVDAAAELRRVR